MPIYIDNCFIGWGIWSLLYAHQVQYIAVEIVATIQRNPPRLLAVFYDFNMRCSLLVSLLTLSEKWRVSYTHIPYREGCEVPNNFVISFTILGVFILCE